MNWLGYGWMILGILWLVVGQIKGYHMTEGEKLVELWFYWLVSLSCLLLGYWIHRRKK